jgi:hypothetical protein
MIGETVTGWSTNIMVGSHEIFGLRSGKGKLSFDFIMSAPMRDIGDWPF